MVATSGYGRKRMNTGLAWAEWLLLILTVLVFFCGSALAVPVSNKAMDHDDISRLHPVSRDWQAKWIWTSDNESRHNWICARTTFEIENLSALGEQVLAAIAVDSRYWMWINGEQVICEGGVKRGPTANDTYMEYVDITHFLRQGRNTVAVLAWFFGGEGNYFSYKSSGKGGLLFEAVLGDHMVIATDERWKVRKHTGYLISTEENNPGSQVNYRLAEGNILYDASTAGDLISGGVEVWMQPDYDDSAWENAVVYGNAGDAPWNALYERSIPQLWYSERRMFENPESYAAYMDEYTREAVTISLDLPGNMQITPVLELDAVSDGLKIDMDTTGAKDTLRASYITVAGSQEWECPGWISTQALTVTIPAGVRIKGIYYRQSGYPAEQAGVFSCDDESLNQLWQESFNTLCICMRDNFMDCPDRERAQWWADVTSQMHEMFYTLDSRAELLYRKGVDTIIGWTSQDPSDAFYHVLRTVVPANEEIYELPQQELYGIIGFWLYYLYTGQKDFLYEVYQPAVDYLKLWEMSTDGLVRHREGTWDWSDWGNNQDNTVLENAWYYWALKVVRDMGRALGYDKDQIFLSWRMASIEQNFGNIFWNGEAYYSHTFNEQPDDRAQAVSVLSGLADTYRYEHILNAFQTAANASPYMEFFVLQSMFEMGYADEAMARMKSRYESFLTDEWTTLGEFFESNLVYAERIDGLIDVLNPSHNHAWSSGPLVILSGYVAGIYPTSPGYECYRVRPQPGELGQICCTVPSPEGAIHFELNRDDEQLIMTVISPGNIAEIWVPCYGEQQITAPASVTFLREESYGGLNYRVYQTDTAGEYTFTTDNN